MSAPVNGNPHVFLDVKIGEEYIGRFVLELFAAECPKTVVNFRALCTGEKGIGAKGHPLHFKGSTFHRIIENFMIQGGDFINHNGTGGESIYGERFNDENLELKHNSAGILSMANAGPNTNSSQFFITLDETPHLNGKHVVFGQVVKGMGVARALEKVKTDGDRPVERCEIFDCGEFLPGQSFGIVDDDGTPDIYPQYPEDSDINFKDTTADGLMKIISNIKDAGNFFFKNQDPTTAVQKYQKSLRYINHINSQRTYFPEEVRREVNGLHVSCLLNHALCCCRLKWHAKSIAGCNKALEIDSQNPKAYFRRGQAHHLCRDYKLAKADLEMALKLEPNDKAIIKELDMVVMKMKVEKDKEKAAYAKLFQ
ncbi:hypothetical protein SK128_000053 [Halocaridina rubra]|uniref:peptidylprolyl isomerase n=1 Tax=Halocaridina rubra TaxID=373956 RepID=A0AAN9AGH6_HALRR